MAEKLGNGGHGLERFDELTGKYIMDGKQNKRYDNPQERKIIHEENDDAIAEKKAAAKIFGFNDSAFLTKEDFEKIIYDPYNPKQFNRRKKEFDKRPGNPNNLKAEDFRIINSSDKFGLESAIATLQQKYLEWMNSGEIFSSEYNEAYEKFWNKYGDRYKGNKESVIKPENLSARDKELQDEWELIKQNKNNFIKYF